MSQSQERLFQKWLEAGDERTFAEWLAHKRETAMLWRRPGAVIPVSAEQMRQFVGMQQGMVSLAQLQQARPGMYHPLGGALKGIGGLFG